MNHQADLYSPLVTLAKSLGMMAIVRSGELLSCQIDHTEDVINRCGKQMHAILSKLSTESGKSDSRGAMEELIGGTNSLLRDMVMAGIDYQMDLLRLMQAPATEVQQAIADSLRVQMAGVAASLSGKTPAGRGGPEVNRRAA